jgi:hypothetical protein
VLPYRNNLYRAYSTPFFCLSQTLRRVPHLTVTWAHQPNYFSFEQQLPSPQVSQFSHANGLPYPIGIASQSSPIRMVGSTGFTNDTLSPSSVKSLVLPLLSTSMAEKKKLTIQTSGISDPPNDVFSSNSASAVDDKRNMLQTSEWIAPLSPSLSLKNSSGTLLTQKKPELTDKDFPPLGPVKGEQKAGGGYWGDRKTNINDREAADGFVDMFLVFCLILIPIQIALDWFGFSPALYPSHSSRVDSRVTDNARRVRVQGSTNAC